MTSKNVKNTEAPNGDMFVGFLPGELTVIMGYGRSKMSSSEAHADTHPTATSKDCRAEQTSAGKPGPAPEQDVQGTKIWDSIANKVRASIDKEFDVKMSEMDARHQAQQIDLYARHEVEFLKAQVDYETEVSEMNKFLGAATLR